MQKECAKRIPTALALLSFRGVLPFLLFFIRSTGTANDGGFVPRCNGCDPFSQCVKKKNYVYLGYTQRECQLQNMFESRISAGAVEKLPEARVPGKPDANTISSWSYDMEGHVTNVQRG